MRKEGRKRRREDKGKGVGGKERMRGSGVLFVFLLSSQI